MTNYCMIETAFDNKEELDKVCEKLLNEKLVAGCQVMFAKSSWNWDNVREISDEYLLFMKTKKDHLKEIYDVIRSIHSYECFEFAVFDLNSPSKDYLAWIDGQTK